MYVFVRRYYEYTLLHTAEDGSLVEDKTKTLFHILPSPGIASHPTRPIDNLPTVSNTQAFLCAMFRQEKPIVGAASQSTTHVTT